MVNELATYNRILVLGCPGAGKTTYAKKIGKILGMPLYHMDELYWLPRWQRPQENIFIDKLEQILVQPRWLLEGNYFRYLDLRLNYADAIVLLHQPSLICLWRVFIRYIARKHGKDEALAPHLKHQHTIQLKIALRLTKNILTFSSQTLPKMLQKIKTRSIPLYVIR